MFKRLFAWNDRRRARDTLQDFCDDRVKAIRAFDQAHRQANRALRDALAINREQFRDSFFGERDPVHAGFFECSADLFGIKKPTSMVINPLPMAAIKPQRLKVAA